MEGHPRRLALGQGWRVHMQPVHIPVIWVLTALECDLFPIKSNFPRVSVGIRYGHQVESTSIYWRWQVHLSVVVIGVEEIFPVGREERSGGREWVKGRERVGQNSLKEMAISRFCPTTSKFC